MNAVVDTAQRLWGLQDADVTLIADRENAVYKVTTENGPLALRLHRRGYRSDRELWSELQWMAALGAGGINVPNPVASASGDMLQIIDDTQVDVLSWVPGATLDRILPTLSAAEQGKLFYQIGQEMAKLHAVSDAWTVPSGFERCNWDRAGLLGDTPLWDKFWENPGLSADDARFFADFRDTATVALGELERHLDFGLIHADLVSANVMLNGETLHLIDFDDGGYGFRLFEIATALCKLSHIENFADLGANLINGYLAHRTLNTDALDLFLALRAATYVGWNITRMHETGGTERNGRFIETARRLATSYLDRKIS